jgi:hypothetical protein
MKTAGCPRVLLPTYQTTRRHIPESRNIDTHLHVNLNSHLQRMSCIGKSTNVKFMCHIDEFYVTKGASLFEATNHSGSPSLFASMMAE